MQSGYLVFMNGHFKELSLAELAKELTLPEEMKISEYRNEGDYLDIWSARLSTGLFGLPNCEIGNLGPKGYSEVMLFVGDDGLEKVIELGFITCPVCHPEGIDWFYEAAYKAVEKKYNLKTEEFTDKNIIPFDARRVDWETILPLTGKVPNRLYIPRNVPDNEMIELENRFAAIGFGLPPAGYYNHNVPEKFTEYKIPRH